MKRLLIYSLFVLLLCFVSCKTNKQVVIKAETEMSVNASEIITNESSDKLIILAKSFTEESSEKNIVANVKVYDTSLPADRITGKPPLLAEIDYSSKEFMSKCDESNDIEEHVVESHIEDTISYNETIHKEEETKISNKKQTNSFALYEVLSIVVAIAVIIARILRKTYKA